jgi:hypothetical protein
VIRSPSNLLPTLCLARADKWFGPRDEPKDFRSPTPRSTSSILPTWPKLRHLGLLLLTGCSGNKWKLQKINGP